MHTTVQEISVFKQLMAFSSVCSHSRYPIKSFQDRDSSRSNGVGNPSPPGPNTWPSSPVNGVHPGTQRSSEEMSFTCINSKLYVGLGKGHCVATFKIHQGATMLNQVSRGSNQLWD